MGVSVHAGQNIKSTQNSAVRDHMLFYDNIVSFENLIVLANGTNDVIIKLKESLLIHRDGQQLNKKFESAPYFLLPFFIIFFYRFLEDVSRKSINLCIKTL